MSEAVEVWTEALENVLRVCLPHEFRVQVLSALLDRDRDATPFRIISVGELMAMQFADFRAKREAYALMIQIMVRSITNNHSPETAAALLFRDQHGYGTGSGWLTDYLDGLPGVVVDLKQCARLPMPPDPAGSVRSWWQKQQPWPCHELGAGLSTKSRRHFKRAARGMSSRTVLITMAPTFTMLDSEFSEAATQLLRVLYASATGNAERQECFVCLEPWSVARAPVAL